MIIMNCSQRGCKREGARYGPRNTALRSCFEIVYWTRKPLKAQNTNIRRPGIRVNKS